MRDETLAVQILAFLARPADRTFLLQEIADTVGGERWEVIAILERLRRRGQVERVSDGTSLYRSSWRRTPPPPAGWRDWGEAGRP